MEGEYAECIDVGDMPTDDRLRFEDELIAIARKSRAKPQRDRRDQGRGLSKSRRALAAQERMPTNAAESRARISFALDAGGPAD